MNKLFKNKEEENTFKNIEKINILIGKGVPLDIILKKFKNKGHLFEKYSIFFEEFKNLKNIKGRKAFKENTLNKITSCGPSEFTENRDFQINGYANNLKIKKRRILLKPALVFFAFLLFFSFSYAGTVYASQESLPGEMLYPVKISSEKIYVFFSPGSKKGIAHFNILSRRLNEAHALIDEGTDYSDDSFTFVLNEIETGFNNCKRYGYFNSKSEKEFYEEIECIKKYSGKGKSKGKGKH